MAPTKWDQNPQHITREYDGVTISSRFDGGNLEECEQVGYNNFDLFISPDSAPYADEELYRSFYQFLVTGVPNGDTLSFSIRNMKNQTKLYSVGFKPVF